MGNAPLNTIIGVAKLTTIQGQLKAGQALGYQAANEINRFKRGDADVKAEIIGHAAGDIAQLFIGTGEVKAGAEALKITKIAGRHRNSLH